MPDGIHISIHHLSTCGVREDDCKACCKGWFDIIWINRLSVGKVESVEGTSGWVSHQIFVESRKKLLSCILQLTKRFEQMQ